VMPLFGLCCMLRMQLMAQSDTVVTLATVLILLTLILLARRHCCVTQGNARFLLTLMKTLRL
jgi:hypothetical protein